MIRCSARIGVLVGLVIATGLATAAGAAQTLTLALTPSQSPTALQQVGDEFGAILSKLLKMPVKVYVASDYAAVIEALRSRNADLAFLHTVGYVLANQEAKATLLAKDIWHGKTSYTSRIYVRKASGFKALEDLRGKTIAFVDPTSSSGYIYPMVLLIEKGFVKNRDPKTFFKEALFAGSHDAALLALLNGSVDAAASFDFAREQYLQDKERIEALTWVAETPPIPEAGIAVRQGLEPALAKRIFDALMALNAPEYKQLLARLYSIDGFTEPGPDSEFNVVRAALREGILKR
ncbi:MAG: phosphate/phosphite/phosphonate ABC transporter substrate-binding protein [candidate division NC10 bacterium]|nr:phosphate/phosphite/phosphonate ABC transporter substrate-binding protein [candidate division NC10 bacterium]